MSAARIIGPGRAGGAFAAALAAVGWQVLDVLGRTDDVTGAAAGVDLLLLATPDAAIRTVAAAVAPHERTVVAHVAGSLGLDVLAPHPRRAALHPLVSLPSPSVGAARLREGAWFAVAGDPVARDVALALGGHPFAVADEDRATYHAAACVASNHLVALLGQVERLAAQAGVPFEAFLPLARDTVANVAELGPGPALTGPAARGDLGTVEAHLAALDPTERPAYLELYRAARRLVGGAPPVGGAAG